MEIYKIILKEFLISEGMPNQRPEKIYLNVDQNKEKSFIVFAQTGETLKADFEEAAYAVVKKQILPLLKEDGSYVIDEKWARDQL